MNSLVRRLLRRAGFDLVRIFPPDFSEDDRRLIEAVRPYTLTTPERLFMLIRAVEYVVQRGIPGEVVECGVWRGGSIMTVARTLLRLGDLSRELYLFDTFEGMSEPGAEDVLFNGRAAWDRLRETPKDRQSGLWGYAPLEAVREAVLGVGYDAGKIRFVKGKVEDTIPAAAPERISLLRLDTDWYESTRHELVHLFPRLVPGGVIIIDDYGHWQGARKAVDEYFAAPEVPLLLCRIDYTARIGVKR